eukprot:TRINITY_DN101268_c0_g1_i1.p1 TRINITY_DN101268_c0_g1~~TRINITY_DN101268_c0_g1_i1.p1  ORF type:complete len:412 (-),score=102.72 TRINITY_DN101268_c0_g1_i1:57-1292(-)
MAGMRAGAIMAVLALCLFGSLNTVTMKMSFSMSATGSDGHWKPFHKPWFATFVMFVAMFYALITAGIKRLCCAGKRSNLQSPLIDASPDMKPAASPKAAGMSYSKKVLFVLMPATFDILATGLAAMGFLYIPPSVFQLLRGAEMLFTAFFAVAFLHRKLYAFHWIALALCAVGIVLVGIASVWGSEETKDSALSVDTSLVLFGMGLTLGSQIVAAAQMVCEEWLLDDLDLPGMEIIGFEGMWGIIIMLAIVFPVVSYLPGSDNGHLEDVPEAYQMVLHNPALWSLQLLYTFSCFTYNISGIAVTEELSAVHRVMIEAMRTLCVWVFGLIVHYFVDEEAAFGEVWTKYSWMEAFGFVLLIIGQAVYGAMWKIPGLYYPEHIELQQVYSPHELRSPGAMRNLASAIPPLNEEL